MDDHVGPMPKVIWTGINWHPDRRSSDQGRLGRRRTDSWMPYSTPFVAQTLAQQGRYGLISPSCHNGKAIRPMSRRVTNA